MFENNDLLACEPSAELGEKLAYGLTAKSSVKVSIPIEDEEELASEHEDTENACSQHHSDPCDVLARFGNYVRFHAVEPYDIWEGRKTLELLIFVDAVQKKLGYKFKPEEILTLKSISSNGVLSLPCFSQLGIWSQKSNPKSSLLASVSQKSLFDIKKKNSSLRNIHKIETRKSEDQSFADTKVFKKSGGEKSRMRTTCDQLTKTFLKSGFVTDECKDNKIEALREDLEMNALEKKWELVVMAGEMNKWIYDSLSQHDQENNKIPVLFKIVTHAENFTIVRVDEDKHEEIIPEVVFYKKYHALKKKQQSAKEIDPKIVNQAVLGIAGITPNKSPSNKFSQRDKELNEALLHIMRIKNILQHQHKILSETAINT